MHYRDALSYLGRYTNYERELRYPYDGWHMNLERVRALLRGLGQPDRGLRVVHVAGTKGKGSTAAMVESMVRAAGCKTGLFTSPHLRDFRERIMVSGEMIGKDRVARLVERIIPAAQAVHQDPALGPLTYFEVMTAMALLAFAEERVDLALLEAGLGGRYDATNVCSPALSVLTGVSLDHTDILGDTLEAIAIEKSMIIKPGKPAVIAPQEQSVYRVFSERCCEVGAAEVRVADRCSWRRIKEDVHGQRVELRGKRRLDDLFIALPGEHQLINAATALTVVDLLAGAGVFVSEQAIREGLAKLSWPARFQRIRQKPDVILDGAHNAASAACLCDTLMKLYPGRRVIAVMGLGGDKDVEGFCRELGPALHAAVITRSRAMKAVALERITRALAPFPVQIINGGPVSRAMQTALKEAGPEDVILVTGSFYVIAEAMEGEGKTDSASLAEN